MKPRRLLSLLPFVLLFAAVPAVVAQNDRKIALQKQAIANLERKIAEEEQQIAKLRAGQKNTQEQVERLSRNLENRNQLLA
ncbi:MAG: peptidase, partial [Alistipes sp.]|nr:peptidase [Alistipes sp.]